MTARGQKDPARLRVLYEWEKLYGPLTADLQSSFLARREVGKLAGLSQGALIRVLRRHKRLDAAAASIGGAERGNREAKPSAKPSAKRRTSSAKAVVKASGRKSKSGKLPRAASTIAGTRTGVGGTSGSRSSYHSGMVRHPGLAERDVREECEHCGAKIAPGNPHECLR